MNQIEFRFVVQEQEHRSVRDRELEISERKAHSSRIAHARRKLRDSQRSVQTGEHNDRALVARTRKQRQVTLPRKGRPISQVQVSENQHRVEEVREVPRIVQASHHPIQHGSSDPFDCQPVAVTPRVHQIIKYSEMTNRSMRTMPLCRCLFRDVGLSVMKSDQAINDIEHRIHWDWTFGDEASTAAFLVLHSYSMMRFLPDHARNEFSLMALTYRSRSVSSLRTKLSLTKSSSQPDMCTLMTFQRLFRINSYKGDVSEAKIHANMVLVFAEGIVDATHRAEYVWTAVVNDVISAVMHLRRPMLDYRDWLPRNLSFMYSYISDILPVPQHEDDGTIDENLSPPIHIVCNRLRWYQNLAKQGVSADTIRLTDLYMLRKYLMTSALLDMADLLNHHADVSSHQPLDHLTVASALTTIVVFQKSVYLAPVNGVDMFDSTRTVLPRLEHTMKLLLATPIYHGPLGQQNNHFWILFVGAQAERAWHSMDHRRPHIADGMLINKFWFSMKLTEHAYNLGIRRWTHAQDVLKRFPYNDAWDLDSCEWFETLVCSSFIWQDDSLVIEPKVSSAQSNIR